MNLVIEEVNITEYGKARWDLETTHAFGTPYAQTTWGDLPKKLGIGQARYFVIKLGETNVAMLLLHDVLLGGNTLINWPTPLLNLLQTIPALHTLTFHMQPVFIPQAMAKSGLSKLEVTTILIDFLLTLSTKEHKNIIPTTLFFTDTKTDAENLVANYPTTTELVATSILNIANELKVPESVRKISKGKRAQVFFKIASTPQELDHYLKWFKSEWVKKQLAVNPLNYYTAFKALAGTSVDYAYAYCTEGLLAGTGVFKNNYTAIEFSMFGTDLAKDTKLPGGDLLKEYLLYYYKNQGIRYYDFNMHSLDETDTKAQNINFFKLKWGGKCQYGVKMVKLNRFATTVRSIKSKVLKK